MLAVWVEQFGSTVSPLLFRRTCASPKGKVAPLREVRHKEDAGRGLTISSGLFRSLNWSVINLFPFPTTTIFRVTP
jgi:hypothetical protein